MARNIEIKARIENVEALLSRVAEIADEGPIAIHQDDTFFRCDAGRLKLRQFSPTQGELIFYRRADQPGPKESFYLRSATSEPLALRLILEHSCGVVGRVIKERTLFLVGRTRVHIDRVDGLGDFMELEVVLGEDEPPGGGVHEAHDLMGQLGIGLTQLIDCAYVDLLARAERRGTDAMCQ